MISNIDICGKSNNMGFIDKAKSLFGSKKKPDAQKSIGSNVSTLFGKKITFMSFPFEGNRIELKFDNCSDIRKAYTKCSPVSTIVNRLASSMANGKIWILDGNNNDVSKKYKNIYDLLKNPNPFQTSTEFIKQIDIYRNMYGVTYIYAVLPVGYRNIENAFSLWPVNPERIEIEYKKDKSLYIGRNINDVIEKYVISIENKKIDVLPEHILCIRDSSLDMTSISDKQFTRISGLEHEINNIILAQEAIYSLNKDRGAMGVITNKTRDGSGNIPLTPEQKKQIDERFQNVYGLTEKQLKVLVTDADVDWLPLTFNVRDLMLLEGMKQNIESISDAFNYPFELLANQKGVTFANKAEAIKYLYQDNIIPAANIYGEKLTAFFGIENAVIEFDFSHVSYLKQDEQKRAEALLKLTTAWKIPYELQVITREEYRKFLDLDEKPTGKIYYNGNETTGQDAAAV